MRKQRTVQDWTNQELATYFRSLLKMRKHDLAGFDDYDAELLCELLNRVENDNV